MFSIRGAALLFYSCHISYAGHEIGAHFHSKTTMGPALLKCRAKLFRPHKSQPHQGRREQDSKHWTTCLHTDKSKHMHWTHCCISYLCAHLLRNTEKQQDRFSSALYLALSPTPLQTSTALFLRLDSPQHFNPNLFRCDKFCKPQVTDPKTQETSLDSRQKRSIQNPCSKSRVKTPSMEPFPAAADRAASCLQTR